MLCPSQSHTTHNQNTWNNFITQNNSPLLVYRTPRNIKLTEPFTHTRYIITVTWKTLPDHNVQFFSFFLSFVCLKCVLSLQAVIEEWWCSYGAGESKVCEVCVSGPKWEKNLIYKTHVAQTTRWKQDYACIYSMFVHKSLCLCSSCTSLCPQFPIKAFPVTIHRDFLDFRTSWVCVSI